MQIKAGLVEWILYEFHQSSSAPAGLVRCFLVCVTSLLISKTYQDFQ
jgi:hypothetical protein